VRIANENGRDSMSLSGTGHVGIFCPRCSGHLELLDQEISGVDLYEIYICEDCQAKFEVCYRAESWRELEAPSKGSLSAL